MQLGDRRIACGKPHLVGILNLTDDSFSADGLSDDVASAVARGVAMVAAGADLLDIGAESTRPGAEPATIALQCSRVVPVIAALRQAVQVPLSVDTQKAAVADAALEAGAVMVNDVSGFGDPAMAAVVARHGAGWVLMHMPHATGEMGWTTRSRTMSADTRIGCAEVVADLGRRVDRAVAAGVQRDPLAVDPGVGFGKTLAQNLAFLLGPQGLDKLGLPVYVGPSRKSFIGAVTGAPVDRRLMGTAAAVTACVLAGATFVRVHDVAEMREVIDLARAMVDSAH